MNVADQIAEICAIEGVRLIAGVMGGSATEIVNALDHIPGRTALYCRQERVAVDICDGFARVTGDPGAVFVDAGPGAANAMAGIVNSWGDSVPLLFFAPIQERFEIFSQRFTKELPVVDMFGPVTKWTTKLVDASQVDQAMRTAFMMLRSPRPGPVVIGLPRDLAKLPGAPTTHRAVPRKLRTSAVESEVEEAVRLIAAAERPYFYIGAGALASGATDELVELAELLTLPAATTLNAKGVFPENHRLALGIGGFAKATYSTLQAERFAEEADVALVVGCGFKRDATKSPMPADTKIIQIDTDAGALNSVYQADQAIYGDAKTVLRQMIDAARRVLPTERFEPRQDVVDRVATLKAKWLEILRPRLTSDERPIEPFRVAEEFSQLVDHDRTIVLHDAGGTRGYICQHYEATTPGSFIGYGVQSAMGWSLGAAMGAKVAAPDKLVATFIGDEAFCETAMDLETAVVCETPILVVLLNNREHSLTQLANMSGGRGFNPTLGPIRWEGGKNLAQLALALGADAQHIEEPDEIRPALEKAIAAVQAGRTSVVEFVTARTPHMLSKLFTKEAAGV